MNQTLKAYQFWTFHVNPTRKTTFFRDVFFDALGSGPDYCPCSSPWSQRETRDDWSCDELIEGLASIGLPVTGMCGGSCPVQVEFTDSAGRDLYFRARGQWWEIEDCGEGVTLAEGEYGSTPFAAGYMPLSEVFERISSWAGEAYD